MSFHVPEPSRDTTHPQLRTTAADGNNGMFRLPSVEPGWFLALICSDGADPTEPEKWEHVSVHAYRSIGGQQRTPTWKEMSYVKRLCWDGEDVVMQLHPCESEYVNNHPNVLHLWRPVNATIPTPPSRFVGVLTSNGTPPRSVAVGPRPTAHCPSPRA
jgi:hypothetical protein